MKRLPTIGEVTRRLRRPVRTVWRLARETAGAFAGPGRVSEARAALDPQLLALIEDGLTYGDRNLRHLDPLQRWQLRPELERILVHEVTMAWGPRDVQDLVDAVLRAWGEAPPTV